MHETSDNDRLLARRLTRNVLAGIVFMYGVSVAICLPGGLSLGLAAGVAALPALFAGPFVGGLVTMVMAQRAAETPAATADDTQVVTGLAVPVVAAAA